MKALTIPNLSDAEFDELCAAAARNGRTPEFEALERIRAQRAANDASGFSRQRVAGATGGREETSAQRTERVARVLEDLARFRAGFDRSVASPEEIRSWIDEGRA